ncbi:hypothetical protein WMY93_026582 [Mugilogobius chulae]|uniref:Apple domain-containing protein n=1 Tax=Mugilogobius chulae TaxID=88201 RepID=A0AAW0N858_9GOBI
MAFSSFKHAPEHLHFEISCTRTNKKSVEPSCDFFTFNGPKLNYWGFMCLMKKNPGTFQTQTQTGVTSGYNLRDCDKTQLPCLNEVYKGVTFMNEGYSTKQSNTSEECREMCVQDKQCRFYTFNTVSNRNTRRVKNCYIKSVPWKHAEDVINKKGVTLKDEVVEGKMYGKVISFEVKPDLTSCKQSCDDNPGCLFYQYYTKDYYSRRLR